MRCLISAPATQRRWPRHQPGHVPGCFCCDFGVAWTIAPRTATLELQLTERFHGGAAAQQIHGGVLSTLLDEAMGNVGDVLHRDHATINLDVRFHAPVACGSTVVVTGLLLGLDEKGFTASGYVTYKGDDRRRAEASGRWAWVDSEVMARRAEPPSPSDPTKHV